MPSGINDPLQGANIKPRKLRVTVELSWDEMRLVEAMAAKMKVTPEQLGARWVRGGIQALK